MTDNAPTHKDDVSAGGGNDQTLADLLASDEFNRVFGNRAERYRSKFTAIATYFNLLDTSISSPLIRAELLSGLLVWKPGKFWAAWRELKRPARSWPGFFLGFFWGSYWGLPWAWWAFGITLTAITLSYLPGADQSFVNILTIGLNLTFWSAGNILLLLELVKRARSNRLTEFRPSLLRPLLLLVVAVGVSAGAVYFSNAGGSRGLALAGNELDCASDDAQSLVIQIAQNNPPDGFVEDPSFAQELLKRWDPSNLPPNIEPGSPQALDFMGSDLKKKMDELVIYGVEAIRIEKKDSTTGAVSCAAELHVRMKNDMNRDWKINITYKLENTSDGQLYATVYGLKD